MVFENYDKWEEYKIKTVEGFDTLDETLKKRIYDIEKTTENTYDEVQLEEVKEEELVFIWTGSSEDIEDEEQREAAEVTEFWGYALDGRDYEIEQKLQTNKYTITVEK